MSDRQRIHLVKRFLSTNRKYSPGRWEARRFCQEDWILNVRVFRVVDRTHFEVALFLAEDHEKFVKDAGVMGGLVFLLSEAYNKVGKMEVHFVGPAELARLTDRVEDLEDARELNAAIRCNGDKPLIPWEQAEKETGL